MTVGEITGETKPEKKDHWLIRSIVLMILCCAIGSVVSQLWVRSEPDFPKYLVTPASNLIAFLTYVFVTLIYEIQNLKEKINSIKNS